MSLTTAFVATPVPVFCTVIVYVIVSPGWRTVDESGSVDFVIVNTGDPLYVETVGETALPPSVTRRLVSCTGFGAPSGTVTDIVSGGETRTLIDVAAGKLTTGLVPTTVLSENVSEPGVAPAASVHVHVYVTGSFVLVELASALVSVGPLSVEHEAALVGVTVSVPAPMPLITVLDDTDSVTSTWSPVTPMEFETSNEVNRPTGVTPGTKTRAPPALVVAVKVGSVVQVFAVGS